MPSLSHFRIKLPYVTYNMLPRSILKRLKRQFLVRSSFLKSLLNVGFDSVCYSDPIVGMIIEGGKKVVPLSFKIL